MQPDHERRAAACAVCECPPGRPLASMPPLTDEAQAGAFEVFRCARCGLVYSWPPPDMGESERRYAAGRGGPGVYESDRWRQWVARAHWEPILNEMARRLEPGDLLDVGCGDGLFLELAEARGWRPFGVELDPARLEIACRRHGGSVRRGSVYELDWPDGRFRVVRLCHVIEHLPAPMPALRAIHRVMEPGGVLSLGAPLLDRRVAFLLGTLPGGRVRRRGLRALARLFPPEHLTAWGVKPLTLALDRAGFETVWVSCRSDVCMWMPGFRRQWVLSRLLGLPLRLLGSGIDVEILARKR